MIGLLNSFLGQLYDILIGSIDGGHLGLFFLLGLIVEIVVFLLDDVDGEVVVVIEEVLFGEGMEVYEDCHLYHQLLEYFLLKHVFLLHAHEEVDLLVFGLELGGR